MNEAHKLGRRLIKLIEDIGLFIIAIATAIAIGT